MSVEKARLIINASHYLGNSRSERLASRARWRRLVEKHANSPLILSEDEVTLTIVCLAFIQLDSIPNLRPIARQQTELLFYVN